jgi:iron complex transport system substrate-binding protein
LQRNCRAQVSAGTDQQDVYEIKSSLILQPGAAALTDGIQQFQNIIQAWMRTISRTLP